MKLKRLWTVFLATCMLGTAGYAQDESSDDLYNQVASMEYKQWKFTPRAYYYSWDYKRVLGIKIPIPGLGVHDNGPAGIGIGGDNYVNERWRQMTPLRVSAAAESNLQAANSEKEKDYWKDINIKDLVVYADRSTDLPLVGAKAITEQDREEFSQRILDNIHNIRELEGDQMRELADKLRFEYDVIQEEINIVGDAHEDNSNRLRTLQNCNNRLRKLDRKARETYIYLKLNYDPAMMKIGELNRKYRRKQQSSLGSLNFR